jgi:hypothetical protein
MQTQHRTEEEWRLGLTPAPAAPGGRASAAPEQAP